MAAKRGRPTKDAPPPPTPGEAEGTDLEAQDELDALDAADDGYVNSVLSSEQQTPRRRKPRQREDDDEHDLPDEPPPGWLE